GEGGVAGVAGAVSGEGFAHVRVAGEKVPTSVPFTVWRPADDVPWYSELGWSEAESIGGETVFPAPSDARAHAQGPFRLAANAGVQAVGRVPLVPDATTLPPSYHGEGAFETFVDGAPALVAPAPPVPAPAVAVGIAALVGLAALVAWKALGAFYTRLAPKDAL